MPAGSVRRRSSTALVNLVRNSHRVAVRLAENIQQDSRLSIRRHYWCKQASPRRLSKQYREA